MQSNTPLVSIYIPTKNRVKQLERALKSLLMQTYKNIEIIVVDDDSSDNTQEFMHDFLKEHPNTRYFRHEEPKGANAARNYAIRKAEGHFVTGLDDDDEFFPERIEKMVDAYDDRYAYVFTKWVAIKENGEKYTQQNSHDVITLDDMLYANITGNQVLTTKEMYLACGLFDERLPAAQDYDMWLRMLEKKPIAKMVPHILYTVHISQTDSITASYARVQGYLQCYMKHKQYMRRSHRKSNLITFRTVKKKRITSIKMIHILYPKRTWPRLYVGYLKRRFYE